MGLAFRLLMPLGRIGRGGCRRVGAGLKSGWVVGGVGWRLKRWWTWLVGGWIGVEDSERRTDVRGRREGA